MPCIAQKAVVVSAGVPSATPRGARRAAIERHATHDSREAVHPSEDQSFSRSFATSS